VVLPTLASKNLTSLGNLEALAVRFIGFDTHIAYFTYYAYLLILLTHSLNNDSHTLRALLNRVSDLVFL
jgi:hypothetical protein